MEMINHSKIWHCLEIFAFSYLVSKRSIIKNILWSFFKLISIFSPMKFQLSSEAIQAAESRTVASLSTPLRLEWALEGVIGRNGARPCNSNGLLLLETCASYMQFIGYPPKHRRTACTHAASTGI